MTITTIRIETQAANLKALLEQESSLKKLISKAREELLNTAIAYNSDHKTITTASGTVTIAEVSAKTYSNKVAKLSDKVEEWTLKGAFITSADFQEMDWSDDGAAQMINLSISIDYAILQY